MVIVLKFISGNMSILNICNLSKFYNNICALNKINISINKGDFFSILGKNGAGKSTIIGIISSLINKTSGNIYINGVDFDNDPFSIKSIIGVMPQDFNFNQFETVFEIIINQAGFYGLRESCIIKRIEFLLKLFGLWEKRFTVCANLSGGMKRRLMFVRSIIHDPDILILDEPTAGVDVFSRKIIFEFLIDFNKLGKTILLTTHNFEEVEFLCNRVVIIDKGVILNDILVADISGFLTNNVFILKIDDSSKISNSFNFNILDKNTIELCISKDLNLNYFLSILIDFDVKIYSISVKTNILEKFFIDSLR